jgi:hypothetical protein
MTLSNLLNLGLLDLWHDSLATRQVARKEVGCPVWYFSPGLSPASMPLMNKEKYPAVLDSSVRLHDECLGKVMSTREHKFSA